MDKTSRPRRIGGRPAVVLGITTSVIVGLWLVVLHDAQGDRERAAFPLVIRWLRDSALALPFVIGAVLAAVFIAELAMRSRRRDFLFQAVIASAAALAASVTAALGEPFIEWMFQTRHAVAAPIFVNLERDMLVALAVALPLAVGYVFWVDRRNREPGLPASEPANGPTRRQFLTYGATSVAALAAVKVGFERLAGAQAIAQTTRHIDLGITDGMMDMIDGTQLYTWKYEPAIPFETRYPSSGVMLPTLPDGTLASDQVMRRHWASVFPNKVLQVEIGEVVEISVTNHLADTHNFVIREDDPELPVYLDSGPIGPGETVKLTLPLDPNQDPHLEQGTYIFEDDLDKANEQTAGKLGGVNRSLGLHGVLIVTGPDPYMIMAMDGSAIEVERQMVWLFNDHDPAWNAAAQAGQASTLDIRNHTPQYFTINGISGLEAIEGPAGGLTVRPAGKVRTDFREPNGDPGILIRLINVGLEVHGAHIHGNHVIVTNPGMAFMDHFHAHEAGHEPPPIEVVPPFAEKDVVPIHPRQRKEFILPLHAAFDSATPVAPGQEFHYPVHSHAEMSQTAAGGLYPGGQVTDWILIT